MLRRHRDLVEVAVVHLEHEGGLVLLPAVTRHEDERPIAAEVGIIEALHDGQIEAGGRDSRAHVVDRSRGIAEHQTEILLDEALGALGRRQRFGRDVAGPTGRPVAVAAVGVERVQRAGLRKRTGIVRQSRGLGGDLERRP